MDGTICDSGMTCLRGVCVPDSLAPQGSCLYGDNYIVPSIIDPGLAGQQFKVNCVEAFRIIRALNRSIEAYCKDPFFKTYCCQSCKSEITIF
jgi:hypothetical protein